MAKLKGQAESFESAIKKLEKIIQELESTDISLEEALKQFEHAVTLLKICETHLGNAEGKIKELLSGENGSLVEKILGTTVNFLTTQSGDNP